MKLSPDYKVFINGLGSLPIQSTPTDAQLAPLNRSTVHYRDLNTDVSGCTISMGLESSPGTASFNINVPRHRTDALAYIRDGEIMVKPMMEVHIYLRGRFNDPDNSSKYYLAFWGIVSTVQEQYSDGTHSISVSCVDILRWWEITKIVTSPAAVAAAEVPGQNVTGLSSIYTGLDAHTIIYDLGKFSMQNFMLPSPVNVGSGLEQTQQTSLFNREATITAGYWRERFKAIRSAQRLFGFDGFVKECSKQVLGSNKPDVNARKEAETEADRQAQKEDVAGSNYIYTKVKTCDNQIQAVYPYKTSEGRDVGQSESQQRSKLEVAREVAQNIHWEFFLDMDGTIVFKPPFYNLDVRSNEPSVIRDIDIINYTRTETEQGALTSLYVSARQENSQQSQPVFGGWWIDWPLALTLGLRHEPREEWRIMDPKLAKTFAQAELVKHNSMLETLSITIPGRPELRLGYPVYIEPLDSFYYVYNIDHTITSGSTFTTTLSLKSKRTRIRDAAGRPQRLLAAVQSQATGQDSANRENAQTCPALFTATQLLADSRARADTSGPRDERSGKGKSIVNMAVGNLTNSEREAEERRQKETQDVLDADPCNKEYEKTVINDVRLVNDKHFDNRLTKDGIAPGEWVLKENHPVIPQSAGSNNREPVDGKDLVDAIQLSDEQGYKLFGPFLYARFVSLSGKGVMESAPSEPIDYVTTRDASQVQNSQADPGAAGADANAGLRYLVNPNVGAVTLRLGTGAITRTGAGVSGEAFVATRPASEEATGPRRPAARSLQVGKVSVDSINNCESGTVAITAGSDTKKARSDYAKLRSCQNQGRQPPPTMRETSEREANVQEGS